MKRLLLLLLIIPFFATAQTSKWDINFNTNRSFIENKGQFDGRNWQSNNPIEYATKDGGWYTFFGKKGITYRLEKLIRNPNKIKGDHNSPSRVHKTELVTISFIGANNNVQIIKGNKNADYYTYSAKDFSAKDIGNRNHINTFEKITYKNIYNNIDIEYTIHKDGGIKYNVILHPGADPSQVKLKYETAHTNISDENIDIKINGIGQLEINTSQNKIIEHTPETYYEGSKIKIRSNYRFVDNILTFELANYDNTKKVIIDPWIVTPVWDDGDFTREVETDAAGNVFVIGGETPMQLRKYTPAGALVWTYNTPFDTIGEDWLGTLATDANGVSYVTQGTGAVIERVNDNGATFTVVWNDNGGAFDEYWTITFNCDNTKLIVGGTYLGFGIPIVAEAKIFEIDLNSGNQLADLTVSSQNASGIIGIVEVRAIAPTKNSKYVYLTHIDVGLVNQNLTSCNAAPDFEVSNGKELAYKCENYLSAAQNGGGLKAIIANDNYFYTHRGDEILQWDVTSGALLNTVSLPGGSGNQPFLSEWIVHCSGLDVDLAGNVYAGSMDRVVKFDANLNVLSSINTTGGFSVYDVSVSSNGEVLAVGALLDNGTSTGRGGKIESMNFSAGGQYTTICCDPNFCPVGPLCMTDAAVNLSPNVAGGTWSSVPATAGLNSSTGVFDPAIAGTGTYVISYTLSCGTNTETIIVANCTAMTLCLETNGDITVTGGSGPYTWAEWGETTSNDCATCGGVDVPFVGCTVSLPCVTGSGYADFTTGITITPPAGADTIRVTDAIGNTVETLDASALLPCSTACDATITAAGPFCVTDAAINLTAAQTGGNWTGTGITNTANGTFNPATAGVGSHTITYTLPTCNDNITIVVTPLPNAGNNGTAVLCANATSINLEDSLSGSPDAGGTWSPALTSGTGAFNPATDGAGTYTYTVTNSCGSDSKTVIVSINPLPITGTNGTSILCAGATAVNLEDSLGGSPDAGGTWSPALTSGTGVFDPTNDAATTYMYTVTSSCGTSSNDVVVTINPLPNTGADGAITMCSTDPSTDLFTQLGAGADAGGSWLPAMTSGTGVFDPATDAAGTYTYTVINSCGTSSNDVVVTISANPLPGTNGSANLCSNASSVNLVDSLGGSPSAGGTWSPALTSGTGVFDPTTDAVGTYTYSVNDCSGTPQTADVVVTIISAPNTGTNGTAILCSNASTVNLEDSLVGSPDAGGTWLPVLTSGTGIFDPATDAAGTYTYSITNSCGTVSSDVVVTINPNLVPGTNGTANLCSNASSINLMDSLNGSPDAGGTWSPIMTSGTGVFDPTTDAAGTYTYSVNDCNGSPQTADIVVTIISAPNTGADGAITFCPADAASDLFTQLGAGADAGGIWSPAMTSGTGMFDPATDAAGTYTYTVTNSCGSSSNDVVVTISTNPSAGTNGTANLCTNASSINLLDSLGGTPSAGGTWSPALTSGTSVFNPTTDGAGTYTYSINDCSGNPLTATVIVSTIPGPDAGTNGAITFCSTDAATDLFTQLGGTPNTGGSWSPTMASGTGVFNPTTDAATTYTYTVTNSCGSANSNVIVTVNTCTTPQAGYTVSDSTICEGDCITITDASTSGSSWSWTFNGGTPPSSNLQNPGTVCYNAAGTYTIEQTVTNSFGSNTATSTIEVFATPIIDAGIDVSLELGESTTLDASGAGVNAVYTWSWLSCVICPTTITTPEETITYTVTAVDTNGCTATDDVTVIVNYDNVIWVPNIFSPNGDGNNDYLFVRGKGVESFQFVVYSRWGEKVFESTSLTDGWNGRFRGKDMNKAVFVYYLKGFFKDGSEFNQKGDITLIR